jgi:hypothetical protein
MEEPFGKRPLRDGVETLGLLPECSCIYLRTFVLKNNYIKIVVFP